QTLPLPAGSTVRTVIAYVDATWAASSALITVGDSAHADGYLGDGEDLFGLVPYDPTNPSTGTNFYPAGYDSEPYMNAVNFSNSSYSQPSGVPYPSGDTLTATIVTDGPVTATG